MPNDKKSTALVAPHQQDSFRGYTIGQLRHQRLLTQLRRDFVKEKIGNELTDLKNLQFLPKAGTKALPVLTIAGKVFKLFSYADYIALGFNLFRSGRRVAGLFKKK